jgi:Cys-tRNA(Pro) deacylase
MTHPEFPVTPAVRVLRERGIHFTPHLYHYEDHGGAPHAAETLGLPLHNVVKTLVMETEDRTPLLVLMHGDMEVSTKQLARFIGAKKVSPCDPAIALKHTGYMVGGISPLGTRASVPVYAEASVLDLAMIYLNGGKRGFLIAITPADLLKAIPVTPVTVAIVLPSER